ncbi:hypothetical protein [Mesorhizobium sp. ZC-5]|uniref:hypothetical protein n=1 Tax=Mesorhizobium sp. ZC-5 TaxID=2986066 RepID=UPI0021E89E72|nr:hypothetical protein [Mesorhizobium sp. ZC-5]MCV3239180.1 hypothetical protein [Mesorhizobium sp. ZC-5]
MSDPATARRKAADAGEVSSWGCVPSIFAIFWRKAKTVACATALCAMTVAFVSMFSLCSYGFQRIAGESSVSQKNLFLSNELKSAAAQLNYSKECKNLESRIAKGYMPGSED